MDCTSVLFLEWPYELLECEVWGIIFSLLISVVLQRVWYLDAKFLYVSNAHEPDSCSYVIN